MNAVIAPSIAPEFRARVVAIFFALTALAVGVFAVFGSKTWLATVACFGIIFVAAMILPIRIMPFVVAVLIPFQIYFPLAETSFVLRGAVVFVFFIALRLILQRRESLIHSGWFLPTLVFLIAAVVAALGAMNKYQAFRGIYEWLAVFATIFVFSLMGAPPKNLLHVLIAIGAGEAILGLIQYAIGLDAVLLILRAPVFGFFFQTNLLKERLTDLSFNWIVGDRATAFGTFINGIDFAIFLAATLPFAFALSLAMPHRRAHGALLVGSILAMGAALVLSFKGTGLIAFVAGAATLAYFFRARLSPRALSIILVVASLAVVMMIPFANLILDRVGYLAQREQGIVGAEGRLAIWENLLRHFVERPFFGFGLSNSIFMTEPSRTLRAGAVTFNLTAPESAYVSALIETGMVGFIALMSLFIASLARAYQNVIQSRQPALPIAILASMVALLFGNVTVAGLTTDQNGMLLGMLIGITFGKSNRNPN